MGCHISKAKHIQSTVTNLNACIKNPSNTTRPGNRFYIAPNKYVVDFDDSLLERFYISTHKFIVDKTQEQLEFEEENEIKTTHFIMYDENL